MTEPPETRIASYAPGEMAPVANEALPSREPGGPTERLATAAAGPPPRGTTFTDWPVPAAVRYRIARLSPAKTSLDAGATNGAGTFGVTTNVDSTPRWSVGQGSKPIPTSGPPASPTTTLAVGVAGPSASTQSMRS